MSGNNAGEHSGASLPETPDLSVGFWDKFASGSMWKEPVLAVLSCSPVGGEHHLILATDGSSAVPYRRENCSLTSGEVQTSAQPDLERCAQHQEKQEHYQHGRLLMRNGAIPCKPELLVGRVVTLLVYSQCQIKGRAMPVVTDLQLLPGRWKRPKASFVSHPLYAASTYTSDISDGGTNRRRGGDTAVEEASARSLSLGKRRRDEEEDAVIARTNAGRSPVYYHSREGPVAKVQRGVRTALSDLHLYSHHWEILARVSYKSDVRCFANAKGESSLFVVHLIDSLAAEVRATFFGRAVSLWHPRLRVGGVYTFSMGTLQRANKLHNPLEHEVEIKFDANAQIEEVSDDLSIPLQRFLRTPLSHVLNLPSGAIIDVLCFVVEAKEPQTIISRYAVEYLRCREKAKNQEVVRRELTLLDSSGAFLSLALFGAQALQLSQSVLVNNPLVAIKGVRVNEYAGRACLSSTVQMQLSWFPERPPSDEASKAAVPLIPQSGEGICGVPDDALEGERRWWQSTGTRLATTAIAKSPGRLGFQTLREIAAAADSLLQEESGTSKSFRSSASVFDIIGGKLTWLYSGLGSSATAGQIRACPRCKRKVQRELPTASTSGAYKCSKCCCAVTPEPRWMLSLKFIDFSGTLDCVALGEQGQAIMRAVDTTPEGLSKLEGGGVDTRGRTFADILEELSFAEFQLELTAKCQVYKGNKVVQMRSYECDSCSGAWCIVPSDGWRRLVAWHRRMVRSSA